ncbi:hypothetical protein HMI56_002472 [Coelomomyces lativittatus]|nr:hypothetical protein HMI56_002472 [Coelomomyces lativittatus]
MLDCCRPLHDIQGKGITLGEFGCLALCNGLSARVYRADKSSKMEFLSHVKAACASSDEVVCVCFYRETLQQTGTGHFSPIGGYCAERNEVLILDVARFKYPPYWVSFDLLWEALLACDPVTDSPRGYIVLKKSSLSGPLLKWSFTKTSIKKVIDLTMPPLLETSTSTTSSLKCLETWLIHFITQLPMPIQEMLQPRTFENDPSLLQETYRCQFAKLIRVVHGLPLCQTIVRLMQQGQLSRSPSLIHLETDVSITSIDPPSLSLSSLAPAPLRRPSTCPTCFSFPDPLDRGSPNNLLDPTTPALITLMLLTFPLHESLVVTPTSSHVIMELHHWWDTSKCIWLLRNEVQLLQQQILALRQLYTEERSESFFHKIALGVLNGDEELEVEHVEVG